MALEKDEDQDSGGFQLPSKRSEKLIMSETGKVRLRTGQPGMEVLGRPRPSLGSRAIENGRDVEYKIVINKNSNIYSEIEYEL
ncbi:hypothetical protein TNCV_1646531 [Trichonephila clavipes]|nr:hypothetical protein TNCV_1646531 [Trichonephila clavipes]